MDIKTCKKCNKTFPRSLKFFYKHITAADSLRGKCKRCTNEEAKIRRKEKGYNYPPKIKIKYKDLPKETKDKYQARVREYRRGNIKYKEQNRIRARKGHDKARDSLSDSYLIKILISRGNLRPEDIPQDLILMKRKQLKLKRYVKEQKQMLNK